MVRRETVKSLFYHSKKKIKKSKKHLQSITECGNIIEERDKRSSKNRRKRNVYTLCL